MRTVIEIHFEAPIPSRSESIRPNSFEAPPARQNGVPPDDWLVAQTYGISTFAIKNNVVHSFEAEPARFSENLTCAEGLTEIYTQLVGKVESARRWRLIRVRKPRTANSGAQCSAILHAAVVLIHATLEDFIRSVAAAPFAYESILNTMPPAEAGRSGWVKKLFRWQPAEQNKNLVLDLNKEPTHDLLSAATYYDIIRISSLFTNLGIDAEKVRHLFPALDEVIKRRHQIVQRAGKALPKIEENFESITDDQVRQWISTVREFIACSMAAIRNRTTQDIKVAKWTLLDDPELQNLDKLAVATIAYLVAFGGVSFLGATYVFSLGPEPPLPPLLSFPSTLGVALVGFSGSAVAALTSCLDRYATGFERADGKPYPPGAKYKPKFSRRMSRWFFARPFLGLMVAPALVWGIDFFVDNSNAFLENLGFTGFMGGLLAKSVIDLVKGLFKNVFRT